MFAASIFQIVADCKKMVAQDSGGDYCHLTYFYQKFLLQDTTIIAATNAAGKYWVSMVSDTSLSHIARDYVLIQLTFFVIYIVLIIRIQVSHGQTSKTSVYCMIWIMKLWLTNNKVFNIIISFSMLYIHYLYILERI